MQEQIVRLSFGKQPLSGKKYFSAHASPEYRKRAFVFFGDQSPTVTAECRYFLAHLIFVRIALPAIRQIICCALIEPNSRCNSAYLLVFFEVIELLATNKILHFLGPWQI